MKGVCTFCAQVKRLHRCSGTGCKHSLCQTCLEIHSSVSGHPFEIQTKERDAAKWTLGQIEKWTHISKKTLFGDDERTKWFGIWREGANPTKTFWWLSETRRFGELMVQSQKESQCKRVFPRLVTFLGDRGVGKSTIIRGLMASCGGDKLADLESPIPATANDDLCFSTTGEVNLYADPETFRTESPILYVDCEGTKGGEPLAAQFQNSWYRSYRRHGHYHIGGDQASSMERARAAEEIYPRFLYIFSDVICFVIKDFSAACDAIVNLIKWSEICLGRVVNQYSLPSAIIVINKWNDSHEGKSGTLEEKMFEQMEVEALQRPFFRAKMSKQSFQTFRDLISCYFLHLKLRCIPPSHDKEVTQSTSECMMRSFGELAGHIAQDTLTVGEERRKNWARLDHGQMQSLFRYAFEYLASGRREAFDFSKIRQMTELPSSVTDYMSNFLALTLQEFAVENFGFAAKAIAESLVIEATKSEFAVIPTAILNDEMKENLTAAAEVFHKNHLRCAFGVANEKRCVNTQRGHTRGHQSSSGEDLSPGSFDGGSFCPDALWNAIDTRVREVIFQANEKPERERRPWLVTTDLATLRSAKHQDFISQCTMKMPGPGETIWNIPCLGCLMRKPEYYLPCKHCICGICLKRFQDKPTTPRNPNIARLSHCYLCGYSESKAGWPVSFPLQPPLAGVRILSLDGGGRWGITQLATLKRIEKEIALGVPIAEFFDLIVGANSGGFIAIGLGVHGWDVDVAISKFKELATQGFKRRSLFASIQTTVRFEPHHLYETTTFENQLQRLLNPGRMLFGLRQRPGSAKTSNLTRVGVAVERDEKPLLLTNYDYGDDKSYVDSRRFTWSASRATWTIPRHFSPYQDTMDSQPLLDDIFFTSNPIARALSEKERLWPAGTVMDVLVSLGTTHPRIVSWIRQQFEALLGTKKEEQGAVSFKRQLEDKNLASRVFRLSIDSRWEMFTSEGSKPLPEMEEEANSHLEKEGTLTEIATKLKASLFYWDLEAMTYAGSRIAVIISGNLRCRLPRPTTPGPLLDFFNKTTRLLIRCGTQTLATISLENFDVDEDGFISHSFNFQVYKTEENEEIAIEVEIHHNGNTPSVAEISGSAFTFSALRRHAEEHLRAEPFQGDTGLMYNYVRD